MWHSSVAPGNGNIRPCRFCSAQPSARVDRPTATRRSLTVPSLASLFVGRLDELGLSECGEAGVGL